MGLMVAAVPREWWRRRRFSEGLARFSKPLVALTDRFVGETHAMRVDVTAADGSRSSAVQSHRSFRRVVGQSCAEFTACLLERRGVCTLLSSATGPADAAAGAVGAGGAAGAHTLQPGGVGLSGRGSKAAKSDWKASTR